MPWSTGVRGTLSAMPASRSGFTLVELIVALVLLGVGGATLATALVGERRLRELATVESGIAIAARERLAWLAARRCDAGLGGRRVERWGEERWAASPSGGAWTLGDTLAPNGARVPVLIFTRVACPA
jgi:prepilin-type N-terminal cleavage/methylation domain-containing protein